jgi:hypothetical protein
VVFAADCERKDDNDMERVGDQLISRRPPLASALAVSCFSDGARSKNGCEQVEEEASLHSSLSLVCVYVVVEWDRLFRL